MGRLIEQIGKCVYGALAVLPPVPAWDERREAHKATVVNPKPLNLKPYKP